MVSINIALFFFIAAFAVIGAVVVFMLLMMTIQDIVYKHRRNREIGNKYRKEK